MMLAIPLAETQVRAAGQLRSMLTGWKASEQTLDWLATEFPSNTEQQTVLLKARILNVLYFTNVFAIRAMSQHIVEVFSEEYETDDDCLLVETIAYLEASGRRHKSFASKYCHFFVDKDRFPLFDNYVPRVVQMHLGKGNYRWKTTDPTYRNYYEDLKTLRDQISFSPTVREMDRYLWLRGQWKEFKKKRDRVPLGAEVKDLLKRADSDDHVRTLIDQMCGVWPGGLACVS